MAANYKKRKEQKLAGIIKAEVLESYGGINARGLRFHLLATKANYAQVIKTKFLLVARKCGIEDNHDNRRSIIIIIPEWLRAAFPKTIPAKYKNEVFDILVNVDGAGLIENAEEEREIVVEEEMREKLVAYLTTKVGKWEVRHVLMKHVLTLLHAQFAPFEYELERIKTMLQLEQLLSLVGDIPL
ncbi:hypothetical protein BDB01DRAFT_854940 [Pilobolus umbonatus]|nr:hypothetical protein BDB01DRAFT_854940 [Pilobolus umbonatus]